MLEKYHYYLTVWYFAQMIINKKKTEDAWVYSWMRVETFLILKASQNMNGNLDFL